MDDHREETLALLKLSLCDGVGNGTVHALVEHFGSAREVLEARRDSLRAVDGVGQGLADAVRRGPAQADVDRELDLMERRHVRLVPFFSEDYPGSLRHLDAAAPVLLRVRGDIRDEDRLAIAIVGSRRCSQYGRRRATRLAADLASMGFTVISGLARGIDSEAHRGAIRGKGRTLAVLGRGLAHQLPRRRLELAMEIAENGALISELPMHVPPRAENFPPRNRIISGLSLGVVVVEAGRRSGSLITARHAGEQGRQVFAVPGDVDRPGSRGCHKLIRDGAVLVEDARDVVEELGPLSEPLDLPEPEEGEPQPPLEDPRVLALNDREREVLEAVGQSPLHVDELIEQTGHPASIIASTLMTLEIRGLVRQLSGQRYVRE
jgi:DNA processing protein